MKQVLAFTLIAVSLGLTACSDEHRSVTGPGATDPVESGTAAAGKIIPQKVVLGKTTYFIEVVPSGPNAQVWFRKSPNACSVGDVLVMDLAATRTTLAKAGQKFCTAKRVWDKGKTIAGCTAVAVAAGCATAAVATEGAAAAFCTATFAPTLEYAVKRGAADCVLGIRDAIGAALAGDANWSTVATGVSVNQRQWGDAISYALDTVCSSVK